MNTKPNFEILMIVPPIQSRITVETEGKTQEGVVTGHDTKDGRPVVEYRHDHRMPDGSIVKADKWAWLGQVIDMEF